MKFLKFNTFYSQNAKYNKIIEPILEDYFSPEKVGDEGYMPIGVYDKSLAKKYSTKSNLQSEILFQDDSFYDKIDKDLPNILSGYEKSVAIRLLYGNMINYIISGPMGSGKTSTMDFIINNIANHNIGENSVFIKLDFNENYDSENIDNLMELFLSDLYAKLKVKIIQALSKFKIADSFLKYTEKDMKFAKFYNLYFENIYERNKIWEESEEKVKIYSIFKFIEDSVPRLEIQVDLVMRFLNYLGNYVNKKDGILLIYYDNIDKLPPVAQINILNKIFSFNKIAEVKKIIATRRSTKAKLDKSINREPNSFSKNRSQTVYGHIYHHGPSPRRIYIKKLEYLINNFNSIKLLKSLNTEYKSIIINRSKELIMELENKNSNFSEGIYCIAGESKRLGLTLVQRNFCNHIWEFNQPAPNSNSICRSLYVGNDKHNMMPYNDNYVANIFSNNKMEFSLINYLLFNLIKKEKGSKTAGYYYTFLYENFEYEDDDIIEAFNYLLNDKRALIGGEYFPGYKDSDELIRVDDKIRITELGDRYFGNLYKKGAIYTQNCLVSLKWELGSDIIRKESIVQRTKLMKDILKEAKEIEDYRFELYKYNMDTFQVKNYKFDSVIEHLTYLHYKKFFGIINSFENKNENAFKELRGWIEMVDYWIYQDSKYQKLLNKMKLLN